MLLLDQNISFRVAKKLNSRFPNIAHVSDCKLLGRKDDEIWNFAKQSTYTIVSYDSDFYDLALVRGIPPKIIWLRTGNLSTTQLVDFLISQEQKIKHFILSEDETHTICLELSL
jgi:predicted nuclease of predicted toxin-antitoxin system